MATIFTRVIEGEIPARLVWRDELCVAFIDKRPVRPGHTLVVPRKEVDHWIDLEPDLAAHVMFVAQSVGRALKEGFGASRVALLIAGISIPHAHIHLIPVGTEVFRIHPALMSQEEWRALGNREAPAAELDEAAEIARRSLLQLGFDHAVP